MNIIRAVHVENDRAVKDELFISREVAERYTAEWPVTDWGMITFINVQVKE